MFASTVLEPIVLPEAEAKSQQDRPPSQDHPPAEEREKPVTDWNGYSAETLLALDG